MKGSNDPGKFSGMFGVGSSNTDLGTTSATEFSGTTDETDTSLEIGVSYELNPQVAVEVSYIDFGETSWNGTWLGVPNSGKTQTTAFRVGATTSRPMGTTQWSWVGTGGVLFSNLDSREDDNGTILKESQNETDLYLGTGPQFRLTDQLAARLLYTRYFGVAGDDVDTLTLGFLYSIR